MHGLVNSLLGRGVLGQLSSRETLFREMWTVRDCRTSPFPGQAARNGLAGLWLIQVPGAGAGAVPRVRLPGDNHEI
jgi:hypothetical protein